MTADFIEIQSHLHDSRVFGFMFDTNSTYEANFYIYLQLFGDFNEPNYFMKKALLKFTNATILNLSIKNDLSQGQHFISDIEITPTSQSKYNFIFIFNSDFFNLELNAEDMFLIKSTKEEFDSIQYLKTDWLSLIENTPSRES